MFDSFCSLSWTLSACVWSLSFLIEHIFFNYRRSPIDFSLTARLRFELDSTELIIALVSFFLSLVHFPLFILLSLWNANTYSSICSSFTFTRCSMRVCLFLCHWKHHSHSDHDKNISVVQSSGSSFLLFNTRSFSDRDGWLVHGHRSAWELSLF